MRSSTALAAFVAMTTVHCFPTEFPTKIELLDRHTTSFSFCQESLVTDHLVARGSQANLKIRTCSAQQTNLMNSRDVSASEECVTGEESTVSFEYFTTGGKANSTTEDPDAVLSGLETNRPKNTDCTQNHLVSASLLNIAVSINSGKNISASSISPVFEKLREQLKSGDLMQDTIFQLCDETRKDGANVFGVAINLNGDMQKVEEIAMAWSLGKCVDIAGKDVAKIDVPIVENHQTSTTTRKTNQSDHRRHKAGHMRHFHI